MFQKATKRKAKLRIAYCGPSGAGKTHSSLVTAKGLGGPIAMIDTEQGSGELYADLVDYDVVGLNPPFNPKKYIEAIKEAEKNGYNVLIIDSLSHAWAGEGGILEEVDKRKTSQKNQFTAWRDVTPMHNELVNAILQCKCHVIATMRSKTAYDLQKDEKGQLKPVKVGLAPVQREGMEYEFTVVLDLEVEKHIARKSKDRTGLFDNQYFVPSVETGRALIGWLNTATSAAAKENPEQSAGSQSGSEWPADEQIKEINTLSTQIGLDRDQKIRRINTWLENKGLTSEVTSSRELTKDQASQLIEDMRKTINNHDLV